MKHNYKFLLLVSAPLLLWGSMAQAADCPEAINKMKTESFLTKEFKWKAPPSAEGEEIPALPDLDCKQTGQLSVGGVMTSVFQVGLQKQKKKIAILTPELGDAVILRAEPKSLEDANAKAFSTALPLAKEMTVWRRLLRTDYEIKGQDVCAKTMGPEAVVKGLAVTCTGPSKKTTVTAKIELGTGILSPGKAQQLALKEFARIEKEEEVPDVKEIFGDKDTVWKLHLGADVKSSYYVFWMSQFSASGIIVMAAFMDETVKSEVVNGAFEYDAKIVSARTTKWLKER